MAKLIITSGENTGRAFELGDTQIIGRLPSNAIPIKDEGSSRQNTRIYKSGGKFTVIDLNSKNGTHVNGEQVARSELKDGDAVRIGSTTFRFEAGAPDPAPAPTRPTGSPSPRTGERYASPDAIQYGGQGVSDRAIRVGGARATTGTFRWFRADVWQHSVLYRALLLLGLLLLGAGIAFLVYRMTAGS